MGQNSTNKELRTIPITNGFISKKINDLLYGYLQCNSYIDNKKRRFCYTMSVNYANLVKEFGGLFSKSKLHRDMQNLIKLGFVEEGTVIDLYGEERKVYLLPFDTKIDIYKFIPLETLTFMVDNLPLHSIQVYSYLLNRFDGFGSRYTFTKKELINVLGVKNPKQRDYEIINEILEELVNIGLIEYASFYESYEKAVTPKIRLLKVNDYCTVRDNAGDCNQEATSLGQEDNSEYNEDAESIWGAPRTNNINYGRYEPAGNYDLTF